MDQIIINGLSNNGLENQNINAGKNYIQSGNAGAIMSSLQNIIQYQVIKNMSTGVFFIDAILQIVAISFITCCMAQLKSFFDFLTESTKWILKQISVLFYELYRKSIEHKKNTKIKKTTEIPYITEQRQINELYKAVQWYLSTNIDIDYSKDSDIQYVYETKITPDNYNEVMENLKIGKVLKNNNNKELQFKSHTIKYSFMTELITIYTDREKKRENQIIKLSVEIDNIGKTDILEDFCNNCVIKFLESQIGSSWKQMIYINKENEWLKENSGNTRGLHSVILQNNIKNDICNDLKLFLDSEDWYTQRDIPYTRGYLFYGLPGTGKTSMIKALSLSCKRHIHFLMLQNIKSDEQLFNLLKNINFKETIVVIEDIDATIEAVKERTLGENKENAENNEPSYKARDMHQKHTEENNKDNKDDENNKENKYKNNLLKGITLSGLLNALDGLFNCHGRILIMTSNRPEILDKALIRSGRVDVKFLFDNCDKTQIKELYEMFFNKNVIETQLNVIKAESYSPAQISSIFLRYRNQPDDALLHLDDKEQQITIKNSKIYDTLICETKKET